MRHGPFRHRALIVSGNLDRAILHLGAPAALAALLQAGFLVVDTFWLGRVGAVAIAAASTAGFAVWVAQTLAEGAATGAGAVLARAVGAGDHPAAARAAAAGLGLAMWGAAATTLAGLVLMPSLFAFMGTDGEVSAAGSRYLRIILLGMPAYFAFAWIAAAFRAAGDTRTPLRLLAVAAAANLALDPILIFGFPPLPPLGVSGAALATVAAWLAAAGAGWIRLAGLNIRPTLAAGLRPPREVWQALRVGVPLAAEGALFSLIYIVLTRTVTSFGTASVAALGVGHKLEVLNYFVCAGAGAAATTLVGQNLGAKDTLRAARAAWRTLFLTILPVGTITAILVTFPAATVSLFIPDPAVIAAGTTYVLLVGMSQVFMAAEVVLVGAFAGAQRTAVPAAVEISLTAARIPVAWLLVSQGWGVEAVWFAIAASTVAKGAVQSGLFAAWAGRARLASGTLATPEPAADIRPAAAVHSNDEE